jgi:hypothetical protein
MFDSFPDEICEFLTNNSIELSKDDQRLVNDLFDCFKSLSRCGSVLAERLGDDYQVVLQEIDSSGFDSILIGCEIALEYFENTKTGYDRLVPVKHREVNLVEFLRHALGKD